MHRLAAAAPLTVFQQVAGSPRGLTEREAAERLARVGANQPEAAAAPGVAARFRLAVSSPFVVLLAGLGCVFAVLGDARGWVTVSAMVLASVGLRWWQQVRSDRAIRGLRSRVTVTVTVRRRAEERRRPVEREIPVDDVVPGDVLCLGAGDIVPADARVLTAQRLIVDQSVLSGEQLAVVKEPPAGRPCAAAPCCSGGRGPALDLLCRDVGGERVGHGRRDRDGACHVLRGVGGGRVRCPATQHRRGRGPLGGADADPVHAGHGADRVRGQRDGQR